MPTQQSQRPGDVHTTINCLPVLQNEELRLVEQLGIPVVDCMRFRRAVALHTSDDMTCDLLHAERLIPKSRRAVARNGRQRERGLTRRTPWFAGPSPVGPRTRVENRIIRQARYRITVLAVEGAQATHTAWCITSGNCRGKKRNGSKTLQRAQSLSRLGAMSFVENSVAACARRNSNL